MGKKPSENFYWKDWLSDAALMRASFQTQGIWVKMLCFMWQDGGTGELSDTEDGFCRLIGCTSSEFHLFLFDAEKLGFCDLSISSYTGTFSGQIGDTSLCRPDSVPRVVTIRNRRMFRDNKSREYERLKKRGQRGNLQASDVCPENVPKMSRLYSPIPIPSPNPNTKQPSIEGCSSEIISDPISAQKCPHEKIVRIWNDICAPAGCVEVRVWKAPGPKGNLAARWREDKQRQDVEWWRDFFVEYIAGSNFLTGRSVPKNGSAPFRASLAWAVNVANFEKILNGNYKNRGANTGNPTTDGNIAVAQRYMEKRFGNST